MAIGLLTLLATGVAATLWHTRTPHSRSAQGWAFSTTLFGLVFVITGVIGFGLQKGPALLADSRWQDEIIWPQVWLGLILLVAAIFCWRWAIRDAERRLRG